MFKTENLTRDFSIPESAIDAEARTADLAFSSEEAVDRGGYIEILSHAPGAADFSRLNAGAPLLVHHDPADQVGVVLRAALSGRRGMARVKFGRSARAREIFTDVQDSIRGSVSFGYAITEWTEETGGDKPTIRATKWEALEISLEPVPADKTVGVGRAQPTTGIQFRTTMTPQNTGADFDAKLADNERVKEIRAIEDRVIGSGSDQAFASEVRTRMQSAIDGKWPLDAVKSMALDLMASGNPTISTNGTRGLIGDVPGSDLDKFSFVRFIEGAGNGRLDGIERELSDEWAHRSGQKPQGFYLAPDILAHRSHGSTFTTSGQRDLLAQGTDAQGGFTVATDIMAASFLDLLRSRTLVSSMGASQYGGLVGNVSIPSMLTEPAGEWLGEVDAVTEGTITFGQVTMTPTTVSADAEFSKLLLAQSSMDIESLVRRTLATVLAQKIDVAAINGSGTGDEPEGILNTTGVGLVALGTDGLAPTYADLVSLESEIETVDADVSTLGYLTNASVKAKLKTTLESATSGARFVYQNGSEAGFGVMNGLRTGVSNNVSSDLDKGASTGVCSAIICGAWDQLAIGSWGALDVVVDEISKRRERLVGVTLSRHVDTKVLRPSSFAVIVDALTA